MAETILRLAVLLLTNQIPHCTALPNNLTIIPHTVFLAKGVNFTTGGKVTIICQAAKDVQTVLSVFILVQRSNPISGTGNNVSLASAIRNGLTGQMELKSLVAGFSVHYSETERRLVISFQAMCGDDGLYFCDTTVEYSGKGVVLQKDAVRRLTIAVPPEKLYMKVTPAGKKTWAQGDLMELRCSGSVGSVSPTTRMKFIWEYKNSSMITWIPFEKEKNWNMTSGVLSILPCYQHRFSTLYQSITYEDDDREFLCYLWRDNQTYEELGAYYFVGNVSYKSPVPSRDKWKGLKFLAVSVGSFFTGFLALLIIMKCRRAHRRKKKNAKKLMKQPVIRPGVSSYYPQVTRDSISQDNSSAHSSRGSSESCRSW